MWGSFGMHIDLPKQQHSSEVTMDAYYFCPDLYFRIICETGLHSHFWVLLIWQIIMHPKWSPHANLEVPCLNNLLLLSWPLFQDHFWAWPPWSLLSVVVLANQCESQMIPACQLRIAWPQLPTSFVLTSISGSFVSLASMVTSECCCFCKSICIPNDPHMPT